MKIFTEIKLNPFSGVMVPVGNTHKDDTEIYDVVRIDWILPDLKQQFFTLVDNRAVHYVYRLSNNRKFLVKSC